MPLTRPRASWRSAAIVLSLLGLVALSFAQDKIRILGISIVGYQTTDAGLIRAHSGLNVGQEVTGDDIQNAIQRLWKLNLFSDVQIVEEKEAADGVYIAIKVEEYPRLERLEVKGNRKLKKEDLDKLLTLSKGQVVQPADLVRLENRLKSKYAEMGYLLAEVDTKTYRADSTGRMIVEVGVREGKKVKIRDIKFEGNQAFSDKALRKRLKGTKRKTFLRGGEYKPEKVEEDRGNITEFYRSRGYRDAEVIDDSIRYSDDRRWIYVTYYLNEGSVYHYGNFTWSGNKLFKTEELAAKLRVEPGDLYNGSKFQASLADVGNMYYEKGYIYAAVAPTERVRDSSVVDVELNVVEGSEFKVDRIFIEGNTKTKERVIRRELVLYPGETFDVSKLRRSVREITILNYFSEVKPDVVPISDNQVAA